MSEGSTAAVNDAGINSATQPPAGSNQVPKPLPDTSSNPPTNDRNRLWKRYQEEAAAYDAHFLEKHNKSLDLVVLCAGLFSAVTGSFIIYLQPSLSQDPNEATQALLKIIILQLARNTTLTNIQPPTWEGPSESVIWTQSLLYASLGCFFFGVVGAYSGKHWLGQYRKDHVWRNMDEWRRSRQEKLDAIHDWHVPTVLGLLPALLLVGILLLGAAMTTMLWSQPKKIAIVVTVMFAVGALAGILMFILSVANPKCPYSTPISEASRRIIMSQISRLKEARTRWRRWRRAHPSKRKLFSACVDHVLDQLSKMFTRVQVFVFRYYAAQGSRKRARRETFESLRPIGHEYLDAVDQERDAPSVIWILANSTDPYSTFIAALPTVQEFRWPAKGYDLTHIFHRFIYALNGTFSHRGQDFRPCLNPKKEDTAVTLSKAILCLSYAIPTERLTKNVVCGAATLSEVKVGEDLEFLLAEICNRFGIQGSLFREPSQRVPDNLLPWASYFILHKLCNSDRNQLSKELLDQAIDIGTRTLEIRPLPPPRTIANALMAIAIVLGTDESTDHILMVDKSWGTTALINHILKKVKGYLDADHHPLPSGPPRDMMMYSSKVIGPLFKLWEENTRDAFQAVDVGTYYVLGTLTPTVVQKAKSLLRAPALWMSDEAYKVFWSGKVGQLAGGKHHPTMHNVLLRTILLPTWEEVKREEAQFDLGTIKAIARLTIECIDIDRWRPSSNALGAKLRDAVEGAYQRTVGQPGTCDIAVDEKSHPKAVVRVLNALLQLEDTAVIEPAKAID
ncbi:hypothetical protein FRC04_008485 [Tulasnella sp. 424]|nr:hypothetical protein FRC04_008485 [Tulasnella sp. 424]KAG8973967.1 hypothetical protein FRC05_008024 [Tulasnella sp. 425]